MDSFKAIVIGAGVVGLAVAERMGDVLVVERNDGFGKETSSRNSEVIHAGFYYNTGSLKARLCVEGNRGLYQFCSENNVPFRKIGKMLLANTDEQEAKVNKLFKLGTENGVEGLSLLSESRISALEPDVRGRFGMFSSETGIVDTHILMKTLEMKALAKEAIVAYSCEVKEIEFDGHEYMVRIQDADGEMVSVSSPVIINCAGLSSDRIAAMAGIDIDTAGYRLYYCKGEYFSISNRHKGKISHLVYPAPTPVSLGVHGVLSLDGAFRLGPSAFYVDGIDYSVDDSNLEDFYFQGRELFPFLQKEDLSPAMAGIRPKLQKEKDGFHDFIIREESSAGLPGFINLIGIESPGLTSSPAIAAEVELLYKNFLNQL